MIRYTYSYKAVSKIITTEFMNKEAFLEDIEEVNYHLLWVDIHIEKGESFDDYMEIIKNFFHYDNPNPLGESKGRRSTVEKNTEFYTIDMSILKEGSLGKNINWMKEHFIINQSVIITISHGHSDIFDSLWKHIPSNGVAFRKEADSLLYVILDSICDEYFVSLEDLEELVDNIEGTLIKESSSELQSRILELRRKILRFKRVVTSLRTVTYSLISYDYSFIKPPTIKLIQRVYDNTFKIYEALDAYTDTLATDLSIYETKLSNKMNKTMEFLTVITTIMAPVTLIAGIYGMNFKYMPELQYKASYPVTMVIMIILIILQIIYFKRKKWL